MNLPMSGYKLGFNVNFKVFIIDKVKCSSQARKSNLLVWIVIDVINELWELGRVRNPWKLKGSLSRRLNRHI